MTEFLWFVLCGYCYSLIFFVSRLPSLLVKKGKIGIRYISDILFLIFLYLTLPALFLLISDGSTGYNTFLGLIVGLLLYNFLTRQPLDRLLLKLYNKKYKNRNKAIDNE